MNAVASASGDSDALLDQICDTFEKAWREGRLPRIEDCLEQAAPSLRTQLFKELLLSECECRRGRGETPSLDEYRSRFPEHADVIDELFRSTVVGGDERVRGSATPGPRGAAPPLPGGTLSVHALSGYEVLEEIDRGGMGVVYKARQTALNRLVALKMLLGGAHAGAEQRERFRREAEAAARLHHPNIVQIHEIGDDHGVPFLALEYVDGASLEALLARRQAQGDTMPPRDAATLVRTLAEAMHYAHTRGIVHRDLKPANILIVDCGSQIADFRTVTSEGDHRPADQSAIRNAQPAIPKIADFGLAKLLDHPGNKTATGALLGTPSYMAPEQAAGASADVGPHTDVYALGAVLYKLLTGRPPFQGLTVPEMLEQVRSADPVAPRQLQAGLPRDLETICLKCLRKAPDRRYATAQALADDLGRCLSGEPILARRTTMWERGIKWMRRHPLPTALLATIALLAAGAFTAITLLWLDADAGWRAEALHRQQAGAHLADKLISLARLEWSQDRLDEAKQHLAECPPPYRNRDWRYLERMCNSQLQRLPSKFSMHLAFAADGKRLASAEDRIKVWDVAAERLLWQAGDDAKSAMGVCFAPAGKLLYGVYATRRPRDGNAVELVIDHLDAATGAAVHQIKVGNGERSESLHPDQSRVLLPLRNKQTLLIDLATGEARPIPFKGYYILQPLVSSSGRYVGVAEFGSSAVKIWDSAAKKAIRSIDIGVAQGSQVRRAMAFSHDESRIAMAHFDAKAGTTRLGLWEVATGRRCASLQMPGNHAGEIAFSPDDRRLAAAGQDKAVLVWDLTTAELLFVLRGHTLLVQRLAFSPDGERLASAAADRTIRIWDVRPWE
ncbi:MAG: serine/threonine-protein kinase [Gemmataceae bacterium]|nr:serine/threonine-protein kinase [Gemmataceae bacterium]